MENKDLMRELELLLKAQDWYYQRKNGNAYYEGQRSFNRIQDLIRKGGDKARNLYYKYAKGDYAHYRKLYKEE